MASNGILQRKMSVSKANFMPMSKDTMILFYHPGKRNPYFMVSYSWLGKT